MPAPPFPGVKVIHNPIVVSDDGCDALDAPLENDLAGSAVGVQHAELCYYGYEEMWLSVEHIADPTFRLRVIQISHVKIMAASTPSLAFDHRNRMITVMLSAKCNRTDSAMKNAVAVQDCRKVVKEGFKMILLDERHWFRSLQQLKVKIRHQWTERSVHVTKFILRYGQALGQTDTIKFLRVTLTSTAIVRMYCSFLSVMKTVLYYAGTFELH